MAMVLVLTVAPVAEAQTKRRVFVLHSGMHIILAHPDPNSAGLSLKKQLVGRGINNRDIILLDSPFPRASFKEMVPRAGLILYLESADPASGFAQDAYVRLDKTLKARGITANDDIVWIGHSAGGQIGMTMAHLAHHRKKFPALAKKTVGYRFDTVITLGTAYGANTTPADVKLRFYYSAGDTMIYFLSKHGDVVADSVKSKVRFRTLCKPAPNVLTRVFFDVEHPSWCHENRVIDCILNEFDKPRNAPWRRTHVEASCSMALGQLISRALEAELRISLEDRRR
jgi:pimeloyl-ACP methyl ester carboxylesterase